MKVLVLSTVFPNSRQPLHGLFVFERIRAAALRADVRVVAPVSWRIRGVKNVDRGSARLIAIHPTYYYLPGIGKALDGVWLFLSVIACVYRLRRRFKFDLIDAHFGHPDGCAAILLGWWFDCPVVVTLRGSEIDHAAFRLRRWLLGWTVRHATRIIAVSGELASLAKELGATSDKLQVIENGVDLTRFMPLDQAATRTALSLPPEGRLIVSVGHLVARKGFHRLIAALPRLRASFPDVRLAIVGGPAANSGDYPGQLRAQCDELGLGQSILFAGPQSPSDVVAWLNAADVFTLASEREGCPNVVLEALACGVPVVASRVGEIDQIVTSEAGMLFEPPDDLEKLTTSLLAALGFRWNRALIRGSVETRSWSSVARRVIAQWQSAATRARYNAIPGSESTKS